MKLCLNVLKYLFGATGTLLYILAIARKVIILDLKEYDGLKLVGLATILITLAWGYKIIKQTHLPKPIGHTAKDDETATA